MREDGRTDMTKAMVAFRNSANAHKNGLNTGKLNNGTKGTAAGNIGHNTGFL